MDVLIINFNYSLTIAALPTHDYLALTPSSFGVKGSVWTKKPSAHKEWMAELQFSVSGPGTVGGMGLAFWYTKNKGIPYLLSVEEHPAVGYNILNYF